ncbi:MAG: cytochrome P450 [Hyphomicrobiaceae bacterium]|nr:cytochrome P450 [Hyphomicrobiaceae bacterium]
MSDSTRALYPPTFEPPSAPLPLLAFLTRCARNPLATIPAAAFTEAVTLIEPIQGRKLLWVCDPRWIEQILVRDAESYQKTELERRVFAPVVGDGVLTADGTNWRWQRRMLAPLFRHSEIMRYVPDMRGAAEACVARWRTSAATGLRSIDDDMTDTTFDVIVRTMLAGGAPGDVRSVLEAGNAYLAATPWVIAYGILGMPSWLPHPATWRLRRSARALRSAVGAIIADRRRRGGDANDLLARLLAARDPETGEPLSHDQLVDNLATLLEAGHETTAKALTWTLYLLARAPEWQHRVREEVHAATGGGQVEATHVERLAVTERVIKEAMRLYPPAPMMSRAALKDVTIAGHRVPAGTQVFMPIYAIHRNGRLWDDPARFDPDRFLPERESAMPRAQYLPFGAGPRICLGASFALVEAKVLLASLVAAASFAWDGRYVPEPVSRVTLRPEGGMPLIVEPL